MPAFGDAVSSSVVDQNDPHAGHARSITDDGDIAVPPQFPSPAIARHSYARIFDSFDLNARVERKMIYIIRLHRRVLFPIYYRF